MSVWKTVGYSVGITIAVVFALYIATCAFERFKNCFIWIVRVWFCMPNFGNKWDNDIYNDRIPTSAPMKSRISPLLSTPKVPKRRRNRLTPARVTKLKKKTSVDKKINSDTNAPDLSMINPHGYLSGV
jgi:hypothetical protein